MIRFLRGQYLYYESGAMIIETVGGIGFRVNVSDTSSLLTAREGEEVCVYTYLQVKEDGMALFGFADADALALFEQLITVKGVGPKAGLAIMSLGTPNQIKAVISSGDAASISMAPGVGKKTAERVILELKDKVGKELSVDADSFGTEVKPVVAGNNISEATNALTVLGYTRAEAAFALKGLDPSLDLEALIRQALTKLMK